MMCDRCGKKESGEHFPETSLLARMFKHSDDRIAGLDLCVDCKEGLKKAIAAWWYKFEPQITIIPAGRWELDRQAQTVYYNYSGTSGELPKYMTDNSRWVIDDE